MEISALTNEATTLGVNNKASDVDAENLKELQNEVESILVSVTPDTNDDASDKATISVEYNIPQEDKEVETGDKEKSSLRKVLEFLFVGIPSAIADKVTGTSEK